MYAGAYFSIFGHYWFSFLDKRFPPHTAHAVRKKVLAEVAMGPALVSSSFFIVGSVKGHSLQQSWQYMKSNLPVICSVSACVVCRMSSMVYYRLCTDMINDLSSRAMLAGRMAGLYTASVAEFFLCPGAVSLSLRGRHIDRLRCLPLLHSAQGSYYIHIKQHFVACRDISMLTFLIYYSSSLLSVLRMNDTTRDF